MSWPGSFGRDELLSLSYLDGRKDLVLMGDVGCGKTHMALALCMLACQARVEACFFTASALVMRLRRTRRGQARPQTRPDRQGRHARRRRTGGSCRSTPTGALLFQVVSEAYERQSVVITTNLEFSRWGQVFGDDQMTTAVIDRVVHHGRLIQFRGGGVLNLEC